MQLVAIHSGGQTGADQGGLAAAVVLGLATGGWAPLGYRTEAGAALWLRQLGLREHPKSSYQVRTRQNVAETDGTLVFGKLTSPGSRLTIRSAIEQDKPLFTIPWMATADRGYLQVEQSELRAWLRDHEVKALNVAGNRESVNPGIRDAVRDLLVGALTLS